MVLAALNVCFTVLVLSVHHRNGNVPTWMEFLMIKMIGRALLCKNPIGGKIANIDKKCHQLVTFLIPF